MATKTLTLTDFLLARIGEDDKRERDEWALRGIPKRVHEQALPVMQQTAVYQFMELGAAIRRAGWGILGTIAPTIAKRRAMPYKDHPDYRDEWRP